MNSIFLIVFTFVSYMLAYFLYGKFLSKRIFNLNDLNITPAHELRDDIDYLPSKKFVLFGHHFTSIAGLGPIVGPTIAVIWGWVPAILWVIFGSIFMGAVHDLGSIVVSMRNKGMSIGEITSSLVNKRTRLLFLLIIFFELWMVIAVFALIIAILFTMYPASVLPVWLQIPISMGVGYYVYKKNGNINIASIVAIILMYITIVIGTNYPVTMPSILGFTGTEIWIIILFIYAFIASVIPVWILLQPRDYINALQLIIILALLTLGVLISHPVIVAPSIQAHPVGAPPMIPFLFIIIACGAISGFHSLVGSGTTGKQINKESDATFIGYGGMLAEGALAALVIIAVTAGIGLGTGEGISMLKGQEAWLHHYSSWSAIQGLGAKLGAFVTGAVNMIEVLGVPKSLAATIFGVFLVSFANTSLDTAARIQRYVISELSFDYKIKFLSGKYKSTFFAVATAAILAFSNKGGKGALALWPLFGSVNQLLSGLALLIITVYLKKKGSKIWFAALPMVFMIVMTGYAMGYNIIDYYQKNNIILLLTGVFVFILEIWMVVEASKILFKKNKTI